MSTYEWFCPSWLFPSKVQNSFRIYSPDLRSPPVLIIANGDLPSHIDELWRHSDQKICADGGGNRIYDWSRRDSLSDHHQLSSHKMNDPSPCEFPGNLDYIPGFCIGDFDSMRPDVKEYYISKGVKIIKLDSQDYTDLDKAVDLVEKGWKIGPLVTLKDYEIILLSGALGGNLSQELGNFHTCFKSKKKAYISGENNLILILKPGKNIIYTPIGIKCGILPLGKESLITSTGLKWNLNKQILAFGNFVSTSNMTTEKVVVIENSEIVLWTFDFFDSIPQCKC